MTIQKPIEKGELHRKLIHISSSSIPIGYYFLDKKIVLGILIPLLVLLILFELLKYKVNFLYELYIKLFKPMLREHEYDTKLFRVNGASWVLIGDILSIIIFPKYIAIGGMLLLSLSDSLSAIVGQLYAKKYYAKNRSYLGTTVFLIIGMVIVTFSPKYFNNSLEYILGYTAIVVTAISDSISLPFDDNLIIPIVFCGALYVLYLVFFPALFTYKLF